MKNTARRQQDDDEQQQQQQQQRAQPPASVAQPHPHRPMNVNHLHAWENMASFNQRLAVGLTRSVGTMWTAYSFAFLALIGLLAILGILSPLVSVLVVWFSQTFLQLVFLPILSVGQRVLSRHQELQADEQFLLTEKICADHATLIEQNGRILALLQAQTGGA